MTRGQFLCGCNPARKGNYSIVPVQAAGGVELMSGKRHDHEGYEVCPEHGQRMYGWNSPLVQHSAGQEVIDYGQMGRGKARIKPSTVEDRRDTRDPVADHDEIMASWRLEHPRGGMNGK